MKTITIKLILALQVLFITGICTAQDNKSKQVILNADSLSSGNKKDVLISFFQLAFNKLTGPNKELNFNSNPFAILLKSNPALAVDSNYYKYRALRKTNFSFGLKLDSSYKFNGFSSGIKYALIDRRDSSTSGLLFESLRHDPLSKEEDSLQILLAAHAEGIADIDERRKFAASMRKFYNDNTPFAQLDSGFRSVVKNIVTGSHVFPRIDALVNGSAPFTLKTEGKKVYDSLKNLIKNGLLWTVGLSDTTYKDQFFFSNVLFKTELVKGIGTYKPGSNWEFNTQASLNFLDDSLVSGRDLKRTILSFEPGFNWVIRNKSNDQSWMELKFSGSYYHNFNKLYNSERRDSVTANATLRIRIISDIWVPLEIKYDPKSGNVFGFLNVRANFSSLGKKQ